MNSKWFHLKHKVIKARKTGLSIREIENKYGVPRSTLSGWFQNVNLTKSQKLKLENNWRRALVGARREAVKWHNQQKNLRLREAESQALDTLSKINIEDKALLDLAFAMLYLGEGTKKKVETSLGNSDPLILKLFLALLENNYQIDPQEVRCALHLRDDQDVEKTKKYWARQLGLRNSNFVTVVKDKRTVGSKTYPNYKGVCVISCGKVAIQRKLLYLGRMFCERTIRAVSSRRRSRRLKLWTGEN